MTHCIDYLIAAERFLKQPDHQITSQRLPEVLACERLYLQISSDYTNKLIRNIEETTALKEAVAQGAVHFGGNATNVGSALKSASR